MKKLKIPVKANLFEHQKKAFEFVMDKFQNKDGAALLIEMGCGKSLIAISIAGAICNNEKIEKLLILSLWTLSTIVLVNHI